MESDRYRYWTEGAVHKASHGALRGEKVSGGMERLAYCFVTRGGSISSFPSAHAPTTTYAAIQPPIDGNGASPAAVPTPLAGAKSGDF